ncbi:MAG TPA: TonB-dependent receptor [Bryobacteraceae bacterium]
MKKQWVSLAIGVFVAMQCYGQINSGMITGTVTDPQKGVVPKAKVAVVEDATHYTYSATTNENGEYTVPYLKAGSYSVTVTAAGFPAFRLTGINVVTEGTARADIQLRLATTASEITVVADADQLQSDTTTVESAVNAHVIDSVPNITQNPLYYASLLEGVVGRMELSDSTTQQSFGIGYDGRRNQSALNVGGATAFGASIQLDGLSVTSGAWNEASVLPNTDSLQEVRAVTNNYTAESGRGMGAIQMSTKSGTNAFHGSAYYRMRNEDFNANSFYNNANGVARSQFRVNDFGGTVGGPVIKDKLFFFTSYELLLHDDTPQWTLTVPTAQQRVGDFSQTVISGTNGVATPVTIWDPNNVVANPSTNVYQRAPYPGNVIPNPSPYALKIMSIYPLPNKPPTNAFGANNFFAQGRRTFSRSSNNSRMDYKRGRQSIYLSGGVSIGSITTPSPYTGANSQFYVAPTAVNGISGGGSGSARYDSDDNPYFQVGDTVILSPTVVLDIRAGVNRIHSNYLSNVATNFTPADYASYGIPASVQAVMAYPGSAPDFQSPGTFSNPAFTQNNNKHERQTNSQVNGSITKIQGKWTFKGGAEYRVYLGDYTDYQESATQFQSTPNAFTTEFINASGASVNNNTIAQQGFAGASILAGGGGWYVNTTQNTRPALAAKYFAVYSQNDWHATSRLTVNLGLRWEVQPAPTDRFNRAEALDLAQTNAWGTLGNVVFPGITPGFSRNLWKPTMTNVGPRLGAAYRIDGKTVVRGGFGIAYAANNTGWYDGPFAYNMGAFAAGTQILPYGTNPNGTLVGNFWDPAATVIIPAVGGNNAAPQLYGAGGTFFNRMEEHPPRADMWNLFIERQLSRTWLVSVGYMGTRGVNLIQARYPLQTNQSVPASVLAGCRASYISSNGNNPCAAQVQNPLQPATGALIPFQGTIGQRTIPLIDTYYPYLALLGDVLEKDNGWSSYQSLNVRVRHAFSHGLLLDAHYTHSKAIDTTYTELQDEQGFSDVVGGNGNGSSNSYIDFLNPQNNKKLSYSDVPNRIVATVTYSLPFGKGKMIDVNNRLARNLVSGWNLGSVYTWQQGYPLSPTGANSNSLDNRPNVNPGEQLVLPKNLWGWYNGTTSITLPDGRTYTPCAQCYVKYNPDAFTGQVLSEANGTHQADLYWMGNAAIDYNALRGPGRDNVDFSLSREFRVMEKYAISFRANVTNAFNHTQFRSSTYTMALGGIQTTAVPGQGLLAGEGQSAASYGTHNLLTYDPRQMILEVRVRF